MHKDSLIMITGGHATPAVACIEELRSRGYANLVYVGQKKSILFDKNTSSEYKLITESVKIPFKCILAGKLSLFFDLPSLIWLLRMPVGFIQAFWWMLTLRPRSVLSFGSHVAVPVAFAAKVCGVPVVAHEQTVTVGRSTKAVQRYATKVCYSWEGTGHDNDPKFIFTGNPIRKGIFETGGNRFSFDNNERPVVFITGGNQGAHALNEVIFQQLNQLTGAYNVIHQTGSNTVYNDAAKAAKLSKTINKEGVRYIAVPYVFVQEMAECYHKAFAVITRGGANSVTELLALQKKAIYVPIPTTSGNEQFLNAKLMQDLGLGLVVDQDRLADTNLVGKLQEIADLKIKDPERVEKLSDAHRNAEKKIIDILEENIRP